ncbi:MAG: hypothetical protein H0T46_16235 [Deltaproteobacteria bacterium]|nr:hypothetical protein [Deltaproteobacteria bacterium]
MRRSSVIGLVVHDAQGAAVVVLTAQGRLVHRTRLPQPGWHAFAIERGQLFACAGERDVAVVDLRFGRIQATGTAPHPIAELAVDEDGRSVAIAADVAIPDAEARPVFDELHRRITAGEPVAAALAAVRKGAKAPWIRHLMVFR